ncbi:MAG: ComF family protein [Butyrivibrio sp.]|nr:ComF family protein [Butyrivibrio sp.]
MKNRYFETALDIIYPRHCPVCDGVLPAFTFEGGRIKRGRIIHRDCIKKIEFVKGSTCFKCGKPLGKDSLEEYCQDCREKRHFFKRGYSVFAYRSISGSIYRFKYMGRQEYARFYGVATRKRLGDTLKGLGIEAVVPVPMYEKKQLKRGYNQAEVYAKAVSEELSIPLRTDIVKRVRNTLPMKELDALGRRNNLKKDFIIPKNDVKFKCVLIIDDIYTTGSTIDEIAHEFQMAGVDQVYFLTLAIGQTT